MIVQDLLNVQVPRSAGHPRDGGNPSSSAFSSECAGIVIRIAEGKQGDLKVGDRVCMLTDQACKTHARAPSDFLCKIPNHLSIQDAATTPVDFTTAWQCINEIARLLEDESIFIQLGTSSFGQAAVQIAQYHRANLFVTVESSEQKHLLISKYNIPEDRIFDGRDFSLVEKIRQATQGQGVDVVLNGLSNARLAASLELIKPFGRFIDIGSQNVSQKDGTWVAKLLAKGVTFTGFDFSSWKAECP